MFSDISLKSSLVNFLKIFSHISTNTNLISLLRDIFLRKFSSTFKPLNITQYEIIFYQMYFKVVINCPKFIKQPKIEIFSNQARDVTKNVRVLLKGHWAKTG